MASETLVFGEVVDAGVLLVDMIQEGFQLPKWSEVICKMNGSLLQKTSAVPFQMFVFVFPILKTSSFLA